MHLRLDGQTVQYPYSPERLRRDNPGVSFPEVIPESLLAEWSVFPVTPTAQPAFDSLTQTVVEDTPIQIDGAWTQVWEVRTASAQEVAERQQALKEQITAQVQLRLDDFAASRGYDGIVSACSYATSQHPKYGPEGR